MAAAVERVDLEAMPDPRVTRKEAYPIAVVNDVGDEGAPLFEYVNCYVNTDGVPFTLPPPPAWLRLQLHRPVQVRRVQALLTARERVVQPYGSWWHPKTPPSNATQSTPA